MAERGQRARLADEARPAVDVQRDRHRKHLQCDVSLEARVAGAVHLPHAATTDERADLVDAES